MSIQFRSRISAQYNPPVISNSATSGWCCDSSAQTTKAQCESINGYFIPNGIDSSECPTKANCSVGLQAISNGACCYWSKTDGQYIQYCGDVESQLECINLNEGSSEGLRYAFYPGRTCIASGGDIVCNSVDVKTEDVTPLCEPNDSSNCFNQDRLIGNCCTQNSNGDADCSLVAKSDCYGFWSGPVQGIRSCVDASPCSGVYFSGISGATLETARASLSQITTSTNLIEKIPSVGAFYQGGLFVGIFNPGSPVNPAGSLVYGNQNTGTALNYNARGTGIGTKEKSWVLIASVADFGEYGYNSEGEPLKQINTSYYDGLYNTYDVDIANNNTLLNQIKNYKINGFNDWYLPSQDELALFFKNISSDFTATGWYPLTKEQYMSSSAFYVNGNQQFNDRMFMVSQMADSTNYGKTNATYRYNLLGVRLFRRIYLDE
jgi:hypothetical protein